MNSFTQPSGSPYDQTPDKKNDNFFALMAFLLVLIPFIRIFIQKIMQLLYTRVFGIPPYELFQSFIFRFFMAVLFIAQLVIPILIVTRTSNMNLKAATIILSALVFIFEIYNWFNMINVYM